MSSQIAIHFLLKLQQAKKFAHVCIEVARTEATQLGQPVGWPRSPPWSDREGQRMTEQMVGSGYSRVRSCAMVRVVPAAAV